MPNQCTNKYNLRRTKEIQQDKERKGLSREVACEWETWWKNVLDNMNGKAKLGWGNHGKKFEDARGVWGSRRLAAKSGSEVLGSLGLLPANPSQEAMVGHYAHQVFNGALPVSSTAHSSSPPPSGKNQPHCTHCELNICACPPNSYAETLTPKVMVFGGGAFMR